MKSKVQHKHFYDRPIVIAKGGVTFCITDKVRYASEITGVSQREIEKQLHENTSSAWTKMGTYTKDRDGQSAYFMFSYLDQSNSVIFKEGGKAGDENTLRACVDQVVKFFGQISSIKDHFIADNILIIVFDHQLMVQDVDTMQKVLSNMPECHDVMNDYLDLGYTEHHNSVRIGLKVKADPTFKQGGEIKRFDDGGEIPRQLNNFPNEINYLSRTYVKGLVTPDYTFYVDFEEGDENGNTLMYRNDGSLVSNNYFANEGLMEELIDEDQKYIFIHKNLYDYLDEYRNN
jgi:hypothetical protein